MFSCHVFLIFIFILCVNSGDAINIHLTYCKTIVKCHLPKSYKQ